MRSSAASRSSSRNRKSIDYKATARPVVEPTADRLSSPPRLVRPPLAPANPPPLKLCPAKAGDHPAIGFLLQSIFHAPSANELHQQQDEPGYDPANRVVVKDGSRVVGHVRVAPYDMRLGGSIVRAAKLHDLAVEPALRNQGFASAMLAAAEQRARQLGAAVVLARSPKTKLFGRAGWSVCGSDACSYAGPRAILAELDRRKREAALTPVDLLRRAPEVKTLTVRRWRQVEQNAPPRLFATQFAGLCGPGVRSADYWRWLIARQAYDAFYVCIEGRDRMDLDDEQAPLVGYVFVKQGRIFELARVAGRDDVAAALLQRACGDAIESSAIEVRLDAPASESTHDLIVAGGGKRSTSSAEGGQRTLAKILSPAGLFQSLADELAPRVAALKSRGSSTLGWVIRDDLDPSDAELGATDVVDGRPTWRSGRGGSPLARCARSTFTRLALGSLGVEEALADGRLKLSHASAKPMVEALFPRREWWLPPLPDLLS